LHIRQTDLVLLYTLQMERKCLSCKKLFRYDLHHPYQRYCSRRCYILKWSRKQRGWRPPRRRKCVICRRIFMPDIWHPKATTCSNKKCGKRLDFVRHRKRYAEATRRLRKLHPERAREYDRKTRSRKPELYKAIRRRLNVKRLARMRAAKCEELPLNFYDIIVIAQTGRCWWCGLPKILEVDHLVPVSKGGRHAMDNLLGACHECNASKGNRLWPLTKGKLYEASSESMIAALLIV
jgi:5-methylcytosine-specific restriction endonuclease McrA